MIIPTQIGQGYMIAWPMADWKSVQNVNMFPTPSDDIIGTEMRSYSEHILFFLFVFLIQ